MQIRYKRNLNAHATIKEYEISLGFFERVVSWGSEGWKVDGEALNAIKKLSSLCKEFYSRSEAERRKGVVETVNRSGMAGYMMRVGVGVLDKIPTDDGFVIYSSSSSLVFGTSI